MSLNRCWFKVRDLLVAWGLLKGPRFYMRRHPAGSVRGRLSRRGARRRVRRLSLPALLRT